MEIDGGPPNIMAMGGGPAMVRIWKSVSPRLVYFLSIPVSVPVYIGVDCLIKRLGVRDIRYEGVLFSLVYCVSSLVLIPIVLWSLGIGVRTRSVERLRAVERGREDAASDDRPIRIFRGRGLIRVLTFASLVGGLASWVLALCLLFMWFPPPSPRDDALALILALLGVGFVLVGTGSLVGRYWCEPLLLCEIGEKGILAPDGFWLRPTFVPWGELTHCDIVLDDLSVGSDYFLLWDREGRRRFKLSYQWLVRVQSSDRRRIFSALRFRFPQKEKPVPDVKPALARPAAAAIWDRELDG
jgi:hypothetical protein